MKYVIAFILGAVCGIAAFIFLCCVAVGKMAEEEERQLRELYGEEEHHEGVLTKGKLAPLLPPGDVVYCLTPAGGSGSTGSGSLRRMVGDRNRDPGFDDHGVTWWLTKTVAEENA